ncbi:Immune-associated nucleotide-binding protein 10, partial [Biomphalaria glabrata]
NTNSQKKKMSKGKLNPEHEKCIQTLYEYLKENIDTTVIVDILFQNNIIGIDEKESIVAEKRKPKRNDLLLTIILHSGPGNAFDIFHRSFQRVQRNVYETIEKELLKNTSQVIC